MNQPRKIFLLCSFSALCAITLVCSSCKKQITSHASWDVNILAPLLQSSLSLDDLLADSLLQTNADHSLSFIFSNELFSASLEEVTIEIPDTTIKVNFSLETINLANQSIVFPYSLGAICQQLGIFGTIIINSNGDTINIQSFNGVSTPDNDLDATQFFESADVESGFIDLTIENGLPIAIATLDFQVKNKIDQQIITMQTFTNLQPFTTQTKSIDLSGKHVEGTLVASITNIESPGGSNVPIDTSDALIISLTAHDIKVSSATAVFPSQNLIDDDNPTTYNLSGGAQLNLVRMKTGTLTIKIQSSIPQKSHFEYSLPSATNASGNFISLSQDLPPAPLGGTSSYSQTYDLAGYSFDLTGPTGTEHNTFYSHLTASIDSTGDLVTISKDDSIFVDYDITDIAPDYISGYVGQQIVNVGPEVAAFDIFKKIQSGTLSLEDVDVKLSILNGIGVQGRINLYNLTSLNTSTGNEVPLTWNLLNQPLNLAAATDNPLTPSVTSFELNSSNSNISSLVSNLPDQLKYSLDIFINPNGNTSNYHDFAYDSSSLKANLDLTVPMSLIASDLVLMDTLDFSLGEENDPGDPAIKEGTFNLILYNGFPISANPQLYFYDDGFNLLDSLFASSQTVAAGLLNDQCLVSEKTKSVLTVPIDEARMDRLRSATHVILISKFNTASHPGCSFLKIYDDYTLDVKLTGLFTYYTGN